MTEASTHPQQVRIVLIDDTSEMRELTRTQLRRRDDLQIVAEAEGALEGIESVEHLQPDLVICDITMPQLDGIGAIPLIRQAAPHTRILMWSVLGDSETVHRALDAGADAFLMKGARRQVLEDAIDSVLATSS